MPEIPNLVRFVLGIEIIRSYDMNAEMSVGGSCVYVEYCNPSYARMTDSEKLRMTCWGWEKYCLESDAVNVWKFKV